jgi:hypothetical protein
VNALACVCNARLVEGHAGETSSAPLLFLIPLVLLLVGLAVWLTLRRRRRVAAATGSDGGSGAAPSARERIQSVEEPFDVPRVVETVGVHPDPGRDEQADVHAPFA